MVGGKPGYLRLLVMGSVAETQTALCAAEYLPHQQPAFFFFPLNSFFFFSAWSQSSPVQLFCRSWGTSIDFPFKPILRGPTAASLAVSAGNAGGNQLQRFSTCKKIASPGWMWAELQIRKNKKKIKKSKNGSIDRLSFQVWYAFSAAFLERILRKQGICLLERKERILIIGFSAVVSQDKKSLYQSGLRTVK